MALFGLVPSSFIELGSKRVAMLPPCPPSFAQINTVSPIVQYRSDAVLAALTALPYLLALTVLSRHC
jgi:hypothetical protein